MNVFEDLIEELRDENLLEDTVIDLKRSTSESASEKASGVEFNGSVVGPTDDPAGAESRAEAQEASFAMPEDGPGDERDFYRKRAIDEVSSLQMVEHIISGIEREHIKIVPASYDDLEVKKALHRFVQVHSDPTTTDYAEAEFKLMHETEAWSTALSSRDKKISVSNLRRFCENSRPALSSQALMSLSRFYRNAAYSELSRAKFDLVMTRLFSREMDDEKRRLLFSRTEMIGHIKTLYANWSSVALYSAEDASLKMRAVVAGFDDRVSEAENAETFQELVENAFFNKVHQFKQATGEMFFTPEIVAAAIDCNIRIGNKFVDLIQLEREKTTPEMVEQKYGYEYDQVISEAAGKTLHLVELLKNLPEYDAADDAPISTETKPSVSRKRSKTEDKQPWFTMSLFQVNKWLLMATVLAVIATGALYYWSSQPVAETSGTEMAKDVNLENTEFKDYFRTGRATTETLYAITLPAWDQLTEDKQKEVLQKVLLFANNNGQKNVQIINVRGRNVAFASKTRSEILKPAP